jgi:putative oxidoreductase
VQRLFTTFANRWPGLGLFIQRLVTGVVLVFRGIEPLNQVSVAGPLIPQVAGAVLGLFVLLGLWIPLAGALVVVTEMWIALTGAGDEFVALILAVLGGTIALIGPGAWSIDARLFGRKHIAT